MGGSNLLFDGRKQTWPRVQATNYSSRTTESTARNLALLGGCAVIAFSLLYWVGDVELALALGSTALFTVIALVSMYFKGRRLS